jgi:hypothetical protein
MDVARPDMPSDDVLALIQSAQADLARAGEGGPLRRDPYRNVLIGLSATLSVFGRSISRWERAVADVIAARDPLPEADRVALKADLVAATEDGAYRGMRKEAQRMVRALDRRLVVLIGLWVGGAYVVGVASVIAFLAITHLGPFSREAESQAAWRDLLQNNPDPRPAIASAEIRADRAGRRYYSGLSLWLDPAQPPSAAQ